MPKKTVTLLGDCFFECWRLPIVPGRRQPSIFGTNELNFRVRDGNGWTLIVISTNSLSLLNSIIYYTPKHKEYQVFLLKYLKFTSFLEFKMLLRSSLSLNRRKNSHPIGWLLLICWHLPIVPGRRQPSIFGTNELNFRVRDGNGWTLIVINTNSLSLLATYL